LPSIPIPAPVLPAFDPEVVASTPPAIPDSEPDRSNEELPDADEDDEPLPSSQSSTKENDAPTDLAASRPQVPAFEVNHHALAVQPADPMDAQQGALPPELHTLYTNSTHILERDFAHSPPYTIQRLAELIIYPRRNYRFLPAYLRALDRIVSVSSPVSEFPLPTLYSSQHGGFLTNGDSTQTNGIQERDGLGSDESLGGALLTPIPWLRSTLNSMASQNSQGDSEFRSESTETIEGPNGAGSIETVSVMVNGVSSASSAAHTSAAPASPTLSEQSDASSSSSSGSNEVQMREQGAVTQGELLRQEQEAGVIPITTQSSPRRSLMDGGAVAVGRESGPRRTTGNVTTVETIEDRPPEDTPHARGPDEIGMEDVGMQHTSLGDGLDMEAAVGRGRSKSPQPPPVEGAPEAHADALAAQNDDAGSPGHDPGDVPKDVEKLREIAEDEKEDMVQHDDGDVVLADADGQR
jgi:hypothetical protein